MNISFNFYDFAGAISNKKSSNIMTNIISKFYFQPKYAVDLSSASNNRSYDEISMFRVTLTFLINSV